MGDFNAHNIQWNCRQDDLNGKRFLDSLSVINLIVSNTEGGTHLNVSSDSTSNIDLLIANPAPASKVVNLINCDECFGSDHFPLPFEVSLRKYVFRKKNFRLRSIKTNWIAVDITLENRFMEFFDPEYDNASPSRKYEKFFEIVSVAIVNNTPRKREVNDSVHRNPVEWWDEEFDELGRASFKKWRYSKEMFDYVEYKRKCDVPKKAIKKKKRKTHVKLTETIDLRKNPGYV